MSESISSSGFMVDPPLPDDDDDDVDSLPESGETSSTDSASTQEYPPELSDAEREWRESLEQLELLLTMVLIPYTGKYFGRKLAFWGTS
jgi:hypothetical protein